MGTNDTTTIDTDTVPIRWGVEEIITSEFYKKIKKDIDYLRKSFFIFLRMVYDYSGGLYNLLGYFKDSDKTEIIKIYSNLQKSMFNKNFGELKSPVIDHCLRAAIYSENRDRNLHNKPTNYKINKYFTANQSKSELQNFDYSKRFEYSIVNENNLITDQEKIDKMLNYYQNYRKILYPAFYLDDDIFIDEFQRSCISFLSEKDEVQNYISCLIFKNNYRYLGIGSEKELEFALNNYFSWIHQCKQQMRIIKYYLTKPPFDCLLQLNSNQATNPTSNKIKFDKLFNSAINSYKFITCHYDRNKITNFRQTIYGKDNEEERMIFNNVDVMDLFANPYGDEYGTASYLRNFIIKIDDSIYFENNFKNLSKNINEFLIKFFIDSEKKGIYYKNGYRL